MSKEKSAINVIQESADAYYDGFDNLPSELKKKISCHMLDQIFKNMVVPAIDRARQLDRGYGQEPDALPPKEELA